MKKIIRKYRMDPLNHPYFLAYYGGLKPCVFDIETTGLGGRNTSRVILTAMLSPTAEGTEVTQFLAESPYEEDRVLRSTLDYFAEQKTDFLVTYNGASFDIPFVNRRLEALHFPHRVKMYNLDLYSWLKKNSVLPGRLKSISQKSVEKFFRIGNDRIDAISGKESVKLYYEYVTSHNSMLEKIILTHNREDVVQLYRILHRLFAEGCDDILRKENIHEAQANYCFPLPGSASLDIRPRITGKKLQISGKQHCTMQESLHWDQQKREEHQAADYRLYFREGVSPFPINSSLFPDTHTPYRAEFRSATSDYQVELPLHQYGCSLYADLKELPFQPEDSIQARWVADESCVNDYLILMEEGRTHFETLNSFSSVLMENILKGIRAL